MTRRELRQQTIGEALNLTEDQYRTYTAIHEIGHATAGLGTGDCYVDHCKVTIYPFSPSDGYADVRYDGTKAQLVLLHGGMVAQDFWLRDAGLWTPRRADALKYSAGHDLDAVKSIGATARVVETARDQATQIIRRYWSGLRIAADHLASHGFITGDDICAAINGSQPGMRNR